MPRETKLMEPEEGKKKESNIQWVVEDGGMSFVPCKKTIEKTPSGVYNIAYNQNRGYFLMKNNETLSDNIIKMPIKACEDIIEDIEKFWDMKAKFTKYKMTYKRGILIYGGPGNGKSYLMQIIISNLKKRDGVVLSLNTVGDVENFVGFVQQFRQIEPDRPLIVIFEDIDNLIDAGSSSMSALLNVLDGVNQIDNVVYLATTNYPEKLQERLTNRPSRFDRVYQIGLPDEAVRRHYIAHKVKDTDIKNLDIDLWVKETEGLSISHIKELIVSVVILDRSFEEVIEHFGKMKNPKSSRDGFTKVGFKS